MRQNIIFLIMLIMLVPIAYADIYDQTQPRFTRNQYSTFNITQPCEMSGTFCSAAVACFITVNDPDNTMIVNNASMTYSGGGIENYVFTNTSKLGTYKTFITCVSGEIANSLYFIFNIEKPQLIVQTNTKMLIAIAFMIALWALMLIIGLSFRIYIIAYAAIMLGFITGLMMISIHEIFFIIFSGINLVLIFLIMSFKN